MKKISIILFVFINSCFFSQTLPHLINYQGVARNNSGDAITNSIFIQFNIRNNSPTGIIVFTETTTATPNNQGIFNLRIGENNPTMFSLIDWSLGNYYLEVAMKTEVGDTFHSIGVQQLVSVPYALYAKNAGNSATYNAGQNITLTGPANNPTINSNPNLSLNGNTLSISGSGTPVTLPNYVAGNNITIAAPSSGNNYTINATGTATNAVTTWTNSGSTVFLVNPADNVGIGTTSSTAKLTVTTSIAIDAILAQSTGANGILATSTSGGIADAGVYGNNYGAGFGVKGETISTNTTVAAVQGVNNGAGYGVTGITSSFNPLISGVKGINNGAGPGIYGQTGAAVSTVAAVSAYNTGQGPAIKGSLPTTTVTGGTNVAVLLENGHLKATSSVSASSTFSTSFAQSGVHTIVANSGNNDVRGIVQYTTNQTALTITGSYVNINTTFNKVYSTPPVVTVSSMNGNLGDWHFYLYQVTNTFFSVRIVNTGLSLSPPGNITFSYMVIE